MKAKKNLDFEQDPVPIIKAFSDGACDILAQDADQVTKEKVATQFVAALQIQVAGTQEVKDEG